MSTWQYLSSIEAHPGQQGVYRLPNETPDIRITPGEEAHACATGDGRFLDIRTSGNFMRLRFELFEQQRLLWSLSARSVLRKAYALETATGERWDFKTPFFNVSVVGRSGNGGTLQGRIARSRREWLFSVFGTSPAMELIVAVACLHRLSYFHT